MKIKNFRAPDGFTFDSLTLDHIDEINSVWAQKSKRSFKFLSTAVTQNPSTGLFNYKTGELVAWAMLFENGGLGNLQVNAKYLRTGLGEATYIEHIHKIAKNLKRGLTGHIVHQNSLSFYISTKLGAEWIDNNSFIGVKRKEKAKLIPLWGRL